MLKRPDEKGQAVIEFIMLIPVVLSFLWYLVHVSLAINKSVVAQKHVRSQLFLKMYNHRSGPILNDFNYTVRSHYYLGVAAGVVTTGAANLNPKAPVETLGIGPWPKENAQAFDDPGEAAGGKLRQKVRVRTVFGICTHRKKVPGSNGQLTDFCGSEPTGAQTVPGQ